MWRPIASTSNWTSPPAPSPACAISRRWREECDGRGDAAEMLLRFPHQSALSGRRSFVQNVFGPLIEALACKLGSLCCSRVNFRIDAKHHLSRIGFLRRLPKFPAGFDIIIDRIMKSLLEIGDIVGVKADDIADSCKPAEKNHILGIEFDPSGI